MANQVALTQRASWREYLELTKPRVVALLLLTALVGMALATPTWVAAEILIPAMVGIGLMASSAAAVNHLVDRHIDAKMARTLRRPLPTGALSPRKVLTFAMVIGILGYIVLELFVNRITAVLTLASLVGYAVIYTMYLKRATPQNIVIGGLAGAAPPLLGWTAVTGEIHAFPLLLVMIVFYMDATAFLGTGCASCQGLRESRDSNVTRHPWYSIYQNLYFAIHDSLDGSVCSALLSRHERLVVSCRRQRFESHFPRLRLETEISPRKTDCLEDV